MREASTERDADKARPTNKCFWLDWLDWLDWACGPVARRRGGQGGEHGINVPVFVSRPKTELCASRTLARMLCRAGRRGMIAQSFGRAAGFGTAPLDAQTASLRVGLAMCCVLDCVLEKICMRKNGRKNDLDYYLRRRFFSELSQLRTKRNRIPRALQLSRYRF